MNIRKAVIDDIDLLIKLRVDFFSDAKGAMSREEQEDIENQLKIYLQKRIPSGDFVAFIAEDSGDVLSTAFLAIVERPPTTAFSSNLTGTVYNVFTYPEFRRKGYAEKIMSALLDEAKELNLYSVNLLATPDGKNLYEKLGFAPVNHTYMNKKI